MTEECVLEQSVCKLYITRSSWLEDNQIEVLMGRSGKNVAFGLVILHKWNTTAQRLALTFPNLLLMYKWGKLTH